MCESKSLIRQKRIAFQPSCELALMIHNKKDTLTDVFYQFRQRLTFPGGRPPSIISAKELNYCVRDGNRCDLFAIATEYMSNTFWCVDSILMCQKLNEEVSVLFCSLMAYSIIIRSSPRPISIGQLNTLLYLHLRPINHIVYVGSYQLTLWEILSQGGLHAQMPSAFIPSAHSYPAVPLA